MIVRKDFLNKLKDFGLNSYESKLWLALLSRGVSSAGELSDISNVARSRTYDVLETLEKKGFIITKVGKPLKYIAIPPQEVVERVKNNVLLEADEKKNMLDQVKGTPLMEELTSLHTDGIKLIDPTDKTGAFRGRDRVYEHLHTMLKNAQKNIVIMTTADGLARKNDAFLAPLKKAHKRGVEIKIAAALGKNAKEYAELSQFASLKHTNKDARFVIVDGKEMVLMITDDKKVHHNYDCAVWIDAPYFVDYFQALFNEDWGRMKE